jgi:hypothetical protein
VSGVGLRAQFRSGRTLACLGFSFAALMIHWSCKLILFLLVFFFVFRCGNGTHYTGDFRTDIVVFININYSWQHTI